MSEYLMAIIWASLYPCTGHNNALLVVRGVVGRGGVISKNSEVWVTAPKTYFEQ